jgi:hypothetical protein
MEFTGSILNLAILITGVIAVLSVLVLAVVQGNKKPE